MKRPSLLKAVLDSHRTKLNDFQLAEFNKAAAKSIERLGAKALSQSAMAKNTPWWHITMNDSMWAFVVFEKSHELAQWGNGNAMNKRTIIALEKKGVLKRIHLDSSRELQSVWIIDGVGLNKTDQFVQLDGINAATDRDEQHKIMCQVIWNPNAERKQRLKIRRQILQEIKDFVCP